MGRAKGLLAAVSTSSGNRRSGETSKARLKDSTAFAASIDFVLFPRNGKTSEDGFTIAKAIHEGTGEKITMKGKFGPVAEGELVQVARGAWRDDGNFGEFFQVWACSHADPVTREALLGYLENLPGVGPTMAAAIVDTYGTDCLLTIDGDPSLLLKVKTKGGRHLRPDEMLEITERWESLRADRKNLLYLSSIGLGDATSKKVSAKFGVDCVDIIKANPYAMTKVDGVGFKIADMAAQKLGINSTDPRRLGAGMEYLLEQAENDGHVCLPRADMLQRAPRLLDRGFQAPTEKELDDAITAMIADGRLWSEVQDGVERVYTTEMFVVETRLYKHIEDILTGIDDPDEIPGYILPPEGSILSEEQFQALWRARHYRLSLLTGGPGCGKCVRGNTYVVANGSLVEMRHLWGADSREVFDGEGYWKTFDTPVKVDSVSADGSIVEGASPRIYRQRVQETGTRVSLADGSKIVMTKRHRLLGLNGWTNQFEVGDLIAVPRTASRTGHAVHPSLVTLLAYQIAEGHEEATAAHIHQKDTGVLERLQAHARLVEDHLGISLNGCTVAQFGPKATTRLAINSVQWRDWLEAMGYRWGSRSARKCIPDFIVSADNDTVRTFLRAYIAAEGNVTPACVEISSASEQVMRQLQLMLRRFGVWMRLRVTQKCATNGTKIKRSYWVGTISGPSLRQFASAVGIDDARKQEDAKAAAALPGNPNIDLVPLGDLLVRAKYATGLPITAFGARTGTRAAHPERAREVLASMDRVLNGKYEAEVRVRSERPGKLGHAYSQMHFAALGTLDRPALQQVRAELAQRVSSDIVWVRISAVSDIELDEWVYDLEVDEHHNYVAGGMVTHNTTALREMLDDLDDRGDSYICLAPTGKAAKRMKESTGRDAQTIHRRLGWSGREAPKMMTGTGRADDSEEFKEDVVIVDESSMLDMRLAERMFSHLKPDTRVVLVGDPDQLPAVGAGSVLLDLIESKRVPRTHLTKVFRQQVQGKNTASLLVVNAARIRDGKEPWWSREEAEADMTAHAGDPQHETWKYIPAGTDALKDDFRFVEAKDERTAVAETLRLNSELSDELGVNQDDIMVTAPMRKGGAGTFALNVALQRKRNPRGLQFREGDQPLRIGDRVMNTKNRYGKKDNNTGETAPDIMNGEVGVATAYNAQTRVATVEFEEGELTYAKDEMDALIPAWAATTHKLQGSEAPAIICPYVGGVEDGPVSRMLNRNLVYTAATRAKQVCVIVGQKHVVREAIKRDGSRRNTTLDLKVGAIPMRLKARYEKVQQQGLKSAQQLLGGFALNRVGHRDLTPAGQAEAAAK